MNYYKHHIGDYAKKTSQLTLMEHGAYLLMLHAYYGTEKPLPTGEPLYRMLRAISKAERAAVDSIATQFWTTTETGLINGRAFEEMGSAIELIEIARQNGKGGGRPPKKPSGISSRLPGNNPAGLEQEPSGKALQVPGSRFQSDKPSPTPPSKGGASRQPRSERRAEKDEAVAAWVALLATNGAKRDQRVQAAIDAVGGWSRIAQREQGMDANIVRKAFCDAYRATHQTDQQGAA